MAFYENICRSCEWGVPLMEVQVVVHKQTGMTTNSEWRHEALLPRIFARYLLCWNCLLYFPLAHALANVLHLLLGNWTSTQTEERLSVLALVPCNYSESTDIGKFCKLFVQKYPTKFNMQICYLIKNFPPFENINYTPICSILRSLTWLPQPHPPSRCKVNAPFKIPAYHA